MRYKHGVRKYDEAVNATSIDAPYGISEWDLSGLHEAHSATVSPSRVKESIFYRRKCCGYQGVY